MTFAFLIDSVPFSKAVRDGQTSLGGSESACVGLMRALKTRGHHVSCFVTKLDADAAGADASGVIWHHADDFAVMNAWTEWDVVVALRQAHWFSRPIRARLRLLWNQDLLLPGAGPSIMAIAWALDGLVYVSEYHRRQWEGEQPELRPLGWVTKNGYDPSLIPTGVVKDPSRIIHISRPERGLGPLLQMWPALKAQIPEATLQVCRYQSMYDGEGTQVKASCEAFDAQVAAVNQAVGGITWLGCLDKPALYQAISEAAVMWYPGVHDFAETSCLAAVEAQACGVPFVGSWKGALPETIPDGLLIAGDARTAAYQQASVSAVARVLADGRRHGFDTRRRVQAGKRHVQAYTFDRLALEWETEIERRFTERFETQKPGILRRLLNDDNHVAARELARTMPDAEAERAYCDKVIAGQDQGPEEYAAFAIQDPLIEVERSGRFKVAVPWFQNCRRVLDVACGNGAFAIGLALAYPDIRVHGLDYAAANIAHAHEAAQRAGVADRCTFETCTIYDFDTHALHADFVAWQQTHTGFDGLFVGEFVEHVANCTGLIDGLERALSEGATVVYTCPFGPFMELLPRGTPIHRGHVHCFTQDDVMAVWGTKDRCGADFLPIGVTPRGNPVGHWIIHYRAHAGTPAGVLAVHDRVRRTRPMPRLSVGVLACNSELDLARCLDSVWAIADEIVIGDTGSTDDTKAIAAKFGARVLDLATIPEQPEGFAGARNAVLQACTGDWFLWIDTDETLVGAPVLRHYLDGAVFNGFVIHQNHFYLDMPQSFDIPVRLFRTNRGVRFFGCVHEQPQQGECNADVYPSLQPNDLQIIHTGYLTSDEREWKRVHRNLPLLLKDQQVFPDRLLGKVLVLREAVVQANTDVQHAGHVTQDAARGYAYAAKLFLDHFADPANPHHAIARPWYENALRGLGIGWEMDIALGGKQGGLKQGRVQAERVWVQSHAEFQSILEFKLARMKEAMSPRAVQTDPFGDVTAVPEAVAV